MLFHAVVILVATAWATTLEPIAVDDSALLKRAGETMGPLSNKKQASFVETTIQPYSVASEMSESSSATTQEPAVPCKRTSPEPLKSGIDNFCMPPRPFLTNKKPKS